MGKYSLRDIESYGLPGVFTGVFNGNGKHDLYAPSVRQISLSSTEISRIANLFPAPGNGTNLIYDHIDIPSGYSADIGLWLNNSAGLTMTEFVIAAGNYITNQKIGEKTTIIKKRIFGKDDTLIEPIFESRAAVFGDAVKHMGAIAVGCEYPANWLAEPIRTIGYGPVLDPKNFATNLSNRFDISRNITEAQRGRSVYQRAVVAMPKTMYDIFMAEIKVDPRMGRFVLSYLIKAQPTSAANRAILPNFIGIDNEINRGGIGLFTCGLVIANGNKVQEIELLKYPEDTVYYDTFDTE